MDISQQSAKLIFWSKSVKKRIGYQKTNDFSWNCLWIWLRDFQELSDALHTQNTGQWLLQTLSIVLFTFCCLTRHRLVNYFAVNHFITHTSVSIKAWIFLSHFIDPRWNKHLVIRRPVNYCAQFGYNQDFIIVIIIIIIIIIFLLFLT